MKFREVPDTKNWLIDPKSIANLPDYLNLSIQISTGNKEFKRDYSGYIIIHGVTQGNSILKRSSEKLELNPKDICIVSVDEKHNYSISDFNNFDSDTLTYSPTFIKNFLKTLIESESSLIDNSKELQDYYLHLEPQLIREDAQLMFQISRILSTAENKSFGSDMLTNLYGQELLIEILKKLRPDLLEKKQDEKVSKGVKDEIKNRIDTAIEYMHQNYNKDISLNEISAIAMMSKYHFSRMFKTITGSTPYQFLTWIRLERAKHLLKNTNWSITQVAMEIGFVNIESFTRLFTDKVGVNPNKFRQNL